MTHLLDDACQQNIVDVAVVVAPHLVLRQLVGPVHNPVYCLVFTVVDMAVNLYIWDLQA